MTEESTHLGARLGIPLWGFIFGAAFGLLTFVIALWGLETCHWDVVSPSVNPPEICFLRISTIGRTLLTPAMALIVISSLFDKSKADTLITSGSFWIIPWAITGGLIGFIVRGKKRKSVS